ncbi:MAG: PaaI family thioesterase [Gammaproteobacteria bacterium]|uniref:PaaI family thioesterase n=1 Tax=Bradyrhizobium sp. TaxID=376 RepID=UPI003D0CDFB5
MTAEELSDFLNRPENRSPHGSLLGLEIVHAGDARATVRMNYAPALAGDPASGVLHGGVVTTLLDSASGLAVFAALPRPMPIATLDLRIDYLRPATRGLALTAACHCYKVTRHICFVRGLAYHAEADDPVAQSAASFMLTRAEPAATSR